MLNASSKTVNQSVVRKIKIDSHILVMCLPASSYASKTYPGGAFQLVTPLHFPLV